MSTIDVARRSLLVDFVETYVSLDPQESIEFGTLVTTDNQYKEVKKMVTTYEQQGIEKGIEKGKKEMLLLLLNKKFGELSDQQQQTVLQIDSTQELDRLLLAIMDAKTLAELDL